MAVDTVALRQGLVSAMLGVVAIHNAAPFAHTLRACTSFAPLQQPSCLRDSHTYERIEHMWLESSGEFASQGGLFLF